MLFNYSSGYVHIAQIIKYNELLDACEDEMKCAGSFLSFDSNFIAVCPS